MLKNKIWNTYFLKEMTKVFFLFIFTFYGLYVLIDYASHASSFNYNHARFQWVELITYYLCEFIKRADVIIPFALLLAGIRTLTTLNIHNELVAMMASGIQLQTLLRPLVIVGLAVTFFMYVNEEILLPMSLNKIKHINDTHVRAKNKSNEHPAVQHVALEDKTTILFQSFDTSRDLFFDAYWIRSLDDIYRIKYLYPNTTVPTGYFVDHLKRDSNGNLTKVESLPAKQFPEIAFNKQTLMETIIQPEERSLSELWEKVPKHNNTLSGKESQNVTTFYYKLALPWLCLLAVIGPAPFCVRFTRTLPVFFIYAFSIFGLVAFYLIMDASLVLGKRQVIDPTVAIWAPFLIVASLLLWRFCNIKLK